MSKLSMFPHPWRVRVVARDDDDEERGSARGVAIALERVGRVELEPDEPDPYRGGPVKVWIIFDSGELAWVPSSDVTWRGLALTVYLDATPEAMDDEPEPELERTDEQKAESMRSLLHLATQERVKAN